MLSGIASYLFGSTMEDALPGDSDDVKLTTFPMENEWLLVDRAETVPLPAEHCPLICHLDESMMQPADNQHRLPAPDVVTDRRRPSVTRSMTSRRATATSGNSVAMAAVTRRHQQQMTSRHASSAMTRKSLQRANRVSEHVSHCSRQRRYNYKLCYSDRQRRAF